jgi:hypothetical protein
MRLSVATPQARKDCALPARRLFLRKDFSVARSGFAP